MPNQKGEAQVPVVRFTNRSGRSFRNSPQQVDDGFEIAGEAAPLHLRFLSGSAVQLEMVDAVVPDHMQAHGLEVVVVLRSA